MLGTPFQQEVLTKVRSLAPVYVVGGAVRDLKMGTPAHDLDAVVSKPLPDLATALREWGYHPHILGAHQQTVTLFHEQERLDFTEMRGSIENDALRRDFTVNALYLDPASRELIDPLDGAKDLEDKVLRGCGDAKQRLAEDPLRILRMVRLAVGYGFKVEEGTWEAALELISRLSETASERVTEELGKILLLEEVERAVRLLNELGYFKLYIPELTRLQGLVQNRYHSKDAWEHTLHVLRNTPPRLLLRLAGLFHDTGKWETASHECDVWGKLEARGGNFFLGEYKLSGRNLESWRGRSVAVRGARLDHYPEVIQVKQIKPGSGKKGGFAWVPDGKRHFLGHERESACLVKQILPRFRWSMFLEQEHGEKELLYLIENHMTGTLTFMSELRGERGRASIAEKAQRFAWEHGWDGRGFAAVRVDNLLELWQADFFGGKERAEGDEEKFSFIQESIRTASIAIEKRWQELEWEPLQRIAQEFGINGEDYGRFKNYLRQRAILDEGFDLSNEELLAKEYKDFVHTPPAWRQQGFRRE